MMQSNAARIGVALVLIAVSTSLGAGGHVSCQQCGCETACRKVCRLVKEEKKVEVVCWGCKCEDFCLPGPSHLDCRHCEVVCEDDSCTKDGVRTQPKAWIWSEWLPGCRAEIHTKKKLMKKVETKKVPAYKWVVEDLCPECEGKTQSAR